MGVSKLLIASIAIVLVLVGASADAGVEEEVDVVEPELSDSALKLEIEQLTSKMSSLESSIVDRTHELKRKDESIAHLGKIIEEKSATILSLQREIETIQKKGVIDAEELVKKSHAQVGELEKQVEKLRNDIESQNKRKDALEAQASDAEKKVQELHLKLENLQKANDEQKHRMQKTERALQEAEEELMRAQLEAIAKSKVLSEVHGAWLPPWLATHMDRFWEVTSTHWKDHAQPALADFLRKVSEKSVQAQKWVEPRLEVAKTKWVPAMKEQWVILATNAKPYMQTISTRTIEVYHEWVEPRLEVAKTKWVPAMKEQWVILATNAKPYMQTISTRTIEVYHEYKTIVATYVVRVQEQADPYFQVAIKFSKPSVDRVVTITKPHVEKMKVATRPYTKRVIRAYGKLLKSATTYHHQVQAGIHEHLKKHELTKSLATKELVWFMATALLALPIFLVYRLFVDIFRPKRTTKPARNGHGNHTHRRPKRRHADK